MKKVLSLLILSLSLFMFGCAKKETIDVIDTSGDTISITTKEGSWITFDSTGGSYAPADAGEPVGENGGRIIKEDDPKVKYYSSLDEAIKEISKKVDGIEELFTEEDEEE